MSLFEQQTIVEIPEKAYETLVGEGKKYKDNELLAQSVFHKDAHILRLEQEAQERAEITQQLQDQLRAREKMETLLDKIGVAVNQPPKTPDQPVVDGAQPAQQGLTPEQLNALLDDRLAGHETQRKKDANSEFVKSRLVEAYGNQFAPRIKQEAEKLGISVSFLETVAAENPSAFFRLVGLDSPAPTQDSVTPPRAAVESLGFKPNMNGERTEKYYQELRRSNPALYAKPATQIQKHKDAQRLAEKFFDA